MEVRGQRNLSNDTPREASPFNSAESLPKDVAADSEDYLQGAWDEL